MSEISVKIERVIRSSRSKHVYQATTSQGDSVLVRCNLVVPPELMSHCLYRLFGRWTGTMEDAVFDFEAYDCIEEADEYRESRLKFVDNMRELIKRENALVHHA
ncbi:hypothetical protein [Vibrio breoganii]|uniref:hypothetical protein n=1 Tax=Vibrio breoganii TaxID=553239 RepID=UPI000C83B5A1|nr:hypothetical protein [Vibrio breoganii]PMM44930.1 hypothetical protein BCT52_10255 [Vibrio breoganii]